MDNTSHNNNKKTKKDVKYGCGCDEEECTQIKALLSIPLLYFAIGCLNVGFWIINLFDVKDAIDKEENKPLLNDTDSDAEEDSSTR